MHFILKILDQDLFQVLEGAVLSDLELKH